MLQLLRDLGAQLAWQRDAGLLDTPSQGTLPIPSVVSAPIEVPAAPPPTVAVVEQPAAATPEAPPAAAAPLAPRVLPDSVKITPAAAVVVVPVAPANFEGRAGALRVIQEEVRVCRACDLAAKRTQTVFARGNPEARLCFIGEGPGADEDRTGLPFVGVAGQLLDRIIAAMRLTEDQVYIANIVKCRPPNNRVPNDDEMLACTPFLLRQLEIVKPEVIVALGKTAAGFLLQDRSTMTAMRGRWHSWKGVPVMPTWHPSYVLRVRDDPKSTARAEVWTDMKLVLEKLGLPVPSPRG